MESCPSRCKQDVCCGSNIVQSWLRSLDAESAGSTLATLRDMLALADAEQDRVCIRVNPKKSAIALMYFPGKLKINADA
jgi:hypothetical protein